MEDQRMYRNAVDFIEQQRKLLEIEKQAEIEEFEVLTSEQSLYKLEQLGLCLCKLQIKSIKQGLYGRLLLTLTHPQYTSKKDLNEDFLKQIQLKESKLGVGDNVSINQMTEQNKEEKLNKSKKLVSGIIYKKTEYKVVVSVDGKEDISFLEDNIVALLMEVSDVTYKRLSNILNEIEKAAQDDKHRANHLINVLLNGLDPLQINPQVKQNFILKESENLEFFKKDLNLEQQNAVRLGLSCQTFAMIQGPPGTGKTMTVCELIYQGVKRGMKVLACAGSNIAVDNIVERVSKLKLKVCRIGHPARMLPQVYECCLDSLIGKSSSFRFLKDQKKQIQKLLGKIRKCGKGQYEQKKGYKEELDSLRLEARETERQCLEEVRQESQVICCTNSGAADKFFNLGGKNEKKDKGQKKEKKSMLFDLVVIDECAQSLEISCWIPMLKSCSRVILVGDHKQLPPTIKSKNVTLSVTLFDRLMQEYRDQGEKVSQLLKEQYRMNQQIMKWSSDAVYDGQLRAAEQVALHNLNDLRMEQTQEKNKQVFTERYDTILMFIDTAGELMGEEKENLDEKKLVDKNKSKSNLGEADIVRIIYKELAAQGIQNDEIGIITPYNAQVECIKQGILADGEIKDHTGLEVSTVDGFQGREKECIIVSMVRSNSERNVGFLSDYRRMNVAITRAKRFICLVGDSDTVSSDLFLKNLVEYFTENGEVKSALEFQGYHDVRFGLGDTGVKIQRQEVSDVAQKKEKKEKKEKKKKDKVKKEGPILKPEVKLDQFKQSEFQIQISNQDNQIQNQNQESQLIQENQIQNEENQQKKKRTKEESEEIRTQQIVEVFERQIKEFVEGKQREFIIKDLNAFERRIVHELSEKWNIQHESVGEGLKKNVVLKKAKEIDSIGLRNKVMKFIQNCNQKQIEIEYTEQGEKSVLNEICKEKELKYEHRQIKNGFKCLIKKKEFTGTIILEGDPSKNPMIEIQRLRDEQKLKEMQQEIEQSQQNEKIQQTEKPEKIEKIEKIENNKKKKEKKKKNKPDEEMDDDEFLQMMIEMKEKCSFKDSETQKQCSANIKTLSQTCKFCSTTFCIKHALPETHGCENAVRKYERAQNFKQFEYAKLGIQKVDQDHKEILAKKVQDKIKASQAERREKMKKDSKK